MSKKARSVQFVWPRFLVVGFETLRRLVTTPYHRIMGRIEELLARRPHRSFRQTRKRDYIRSLKLPGYWAFTDHVRKVLWRQRKLFLSLVLVYGVLTVGFVGMASQSIYTELSDTLRETGSEVTQGNFSEVGKAGLLLVTGAAGMFSTDKTEAQQLYLGILVLLVWLATVWLLRATLAGQRPRLRDGLYNAGAPVISTFLVGLVMVVQLLPIAVAIIGYGAASATGLLDTGIESMLFWTVALLLGALSLYWLTSTFIALVVVTLPGMYPMRAIKTAGDLVIGRRVRVLLRLLWLAAVVAGVWACSMIPIILLDTWLKSLLPAIEWLPVVPVALLVMTTLTVIWMASYIYLLYRRIVDDDAAPA